MNINKLDYQGNNIEQNYSYTGQKLDMPVDSAIEQIIKELDNYNKLIINNINISSIVNPFVQKSHYIADSGLILDIPDYVKQQAIHIWKTRNNGNDNKILEINYDMLTELNNIDKINNDNDDINNDNDNYHPFFNKNKINKSSFNCIKYYKLIIIFIIFLALTFTLFKKNIG
jgi:hypothetical protein